MYCTIKISFVFNLFLRVLICVCGGLCLLRIHPGYNTYRHNHDSYKATCDVFFV